MSEEGRKQQNKLKDLSPIAERLGCTLPQLAVGKTITGRAQKIPFSLLDPHPYHDKISIVGQTDARSTSSWLALSKMRLSEYPRIFDVLKNCSSFLFLSLITRSNENR